MQALKRILCLCCVLAVTTVFSGAGFIRAAAETNLPDSFLIGDQDGIQVDTDGMYYIDIVVNPGQVHTKKLTIQNLDQGRPESVIPYTLSMLAETEEETGPIKLLDVVALELKLDGKVIYDGPCRGNAQGNDITETPLPLGDYAPGDQKVLDIRLTVDSNMPSAAAGDELSEAIFLWHFYAVRAMDPEPPKTGEVIRDYAPYLAVMGGMLLFCFTLVVLKKKKEERVGYA
jgi:hypothetical protein